MQINSIRNLNFSSINNYPGMRRYEGQSAIQSHEPDKSIPVYLFIPCYNVSKAHAREKLDELNGKGVNAIYNLSSRVLPFAEDDLHKYTNMSGDIKHIYNRCDGDFEKINEMFKIHKMVIDNKLQPIKK